ncbi:uncharacterized protein LOC121377021 [Gigantopelta aegis]|uniref:uncharacterized protein LOC121377021 n=1 Tax=Gigantopelta aegis TaxID=1735272 RepID=UPI001B88E441|nr:uncharacterized protein LOC121377021 [Gigantopelta aegis]
MRAVLTSLVFLCLNLLADVLDVWKMDIHGGHLFGKLAVDIVWMGIIILSRIYLDKDDQWWASLICFGLNLVVDFGVAGILAGQECYWKSKGAFDVLSGIFPMASGSNSDKKDYPKMKERC